jgi:hypothetical protein
MDPGRIEPVPDCRCTATGTPPKKLHAIVITTDGACRNNGTLNACASVAIYVGEGSVHNACGIPPGNIIHANQQPELAAAF